MATFLLGIGLIGFFFIMMSVRLLFLKNGEFKGTCATQSPFLQNEGVVCGLCGKDPSLCENDSSEAKNQSTELPEVKKKEEVTLASYE